MSFYQLNRTVAYSIGSALSATLLVLSIPHGHVFPREAGYTTAALACTAILAAALAVSLLFAIPTRTPVHAAPRASRGRRARAS
jgi:hypothetical protein